MCIKKAVISITVIIKALAQQQSTAYQPAVIADEHVEDTPLGSSQLGTFTVDRDPVSPEINSHPASVFLKPDTSLSADSSMSG